MFFDVLVELFALVIELVIGVLVGMINLVIGFIELVVGLFISGFKLKRITRNPKAKQQKKPEKIPWLYVALSITVAALIIFIPFILNRTITFEAQDGHTLPFAEVIVHSNGGEEKLRTSASGKLKVSRFNVDSITMIDPRYVKKSWPSEEIASELVVERSAVGNALGKMAEKFFKGGE